MISILKIVIGYYPFIVQSLCNVDNVFTIKYFLRNNTKQCCKTPTSEIYRFCIFITFSSSFTIAKCRCFRSIYFIFQKIPFHIRTFIWQYL